MEAASENMDRRALGGSIDVYASIVMGILDHIEKISLGIVQTMTRLN
jgi:hypothetical protein